MANRDSSNVETDKLGRFCASLRKLSETMTFLAENPENFFGLSGFHASIGEHGGIILALDARGQPCISSAPRHKPVSSSPEKF